MGSSMRFKSDVKQVVPPLTKLFTKSSVMRSLHDIYDTSASWELGRGGCGAVYTVRHRQTGEEFAMKSVSISGLDAAAIAELRNEIEIQSRLDHPNIVKLVEWFDDVEREAIHIILELCLGGSLVHRMRRHRHGYDENTAASLIEKMLRAIRYCHLNGVVHRDIKLDNFIYEAPGDDAELKLIDFGFACEVAPGREDMFERLGTLSYMAPELLGPDRRTSYNSSVDMWSLGVVAYLLLSGRRPFHDPDRRTKMKLIRTAPLSFDGPEWNIVSSDAKDFISMLLQKDPEARASPRDALNHPWLAERTERSANRRTNSTLGERLDIIRSLESYTHEVQLKRLALEAIAFVTQPARMEELRKVFVEMDKDHSGCISIEEFKEAMASVPDVPAAQVERIFRAMDLNQGGEVDLHEFLAATLSRDNGLITASSPSLGAAFSLLDRDGDGFLTRDDLVSLLGSNTTDFPQVALEAMLEEQSSLGHDGRLTFDDFKLLMLRAGREEDPAQKAMSAYIRNTWSRRGLKRGASDVSDQLRYPNSKVLNESSLAQRMEPTRGEGSPFRSSMSRAESLYSQNGSPTRKPSLLARKSDEGLFEPSITSNCSSTSVTFAQPEASVNKRLAFGTTGRASTLNLTSMLPRAERADANRRFDEENKVTC